MIYKLLFSMAIVYIVSSIVTLIELECGESFDHAAVTGMCVGFIVVFAVNLWLAIFRPESRL